MKERLTELLMQGETEADKQGFCNCYVSRDKAECIANFLLANGVIAPPCKVGDTVYVIFSQFKNEIEKCRVDEFLIQNDRMYAVIDVYYPNFVAKRNTSIPIFWFGKFAFFTKEEAEAAIAERNKK